MRLSLSMLAYTICAVDCWRVVDTPLVLRINVDKFIIPPGGFLAKPMGKMVMAW